MVKKLFLGMFAATAMLFATSCQNDELDAIQSGKESIVSFTLEQPGIVTRAYSDGLTAKTLTYAVYEANSKTPLITSENQVTFSNKTATVNLRLVTGKSYDILFWADAENTPYTFDAAAQTITVADNLTSQDENRDAFFAVEKSLLVDGAINKTITLSRPFAQLNIGTTDATESSTAAFNPTQSTVTVKNVYKTLNLFDGAVSNETEMTYAMANIPDAGETFPVADVKYLSMNYLLVASEKELVEVDFTVTDGTHSIEREYASVPVQRNYRTNIYGKILTDPADFNITIDEKFEKPDYKLVYAGGTAEHPEKLETVLEKVGAEKNPIIKVATGSYVSWTTGASQGSTPLIDATNTVTETITIEGEGKNSVLVVDGAGVGSLRAANGAKLIVKNMTIVDNSVSYAEDAWELTYLEFAGNLEFNNVTFNSGIQLQTEGSEAALNATFTNCTFITNEESVYSVWVSDGTSTFSNCKFQGTRGLKMHEKYGSEIAEVIIDACEFGPLSKKPGVAIGDLNADTKVTIKNSSFIGCQPGDQNNYIYESDTDVTTFTLTLSNNSVEEDPANTVRIGTVAELKAFKEAVNVSGNSYSGKTIKLTADIDLKGEAWEPIGQAGGNGVKTYFQGVFDGQGYTIKNMTIKPNATYGEGANYATGFFGFVDAGDAVIKNVTFDNATIEGHHWTAVVCGYISGTIQNCHVTNSSVVCSHANDDACGDKAAMIVGYTNESTTSVKDCTAKNGTVKAGRDAGQIVGCNSANVTVSGCSAENVTVSAIEGCTGANIKNDIVGRQN